MLKPMSDWAKKFAIQMLEKEDCPRSITFTETSWLPVVDVVVYDEERNKYGVTVGKGFIDSHPNPAEAIMEDIHKQLRKAGKL